MTTEITNLNTERAHKENDNKKWSPEDMLEHVLQRIRDGEINPDRMMVLYWEPLDEPGDDPGFNVNSYVSGAYRTEILSMLEMERQLLFEGWIR